MVDKLQQQPKFNLGDNVDFINDYGVIFPNRIIVGVEYWDGFDMPRYFMWPSGNPEHYSSKESNFVLRDEKASIDKMIVENWTIDHNGRPVMAALPDAGWRAKYEAYLMALSSAHVDLYYALGMNYRDKK